MTRNPINRAAEILMVWLLACFFLVVYVGTSDSGTPAPTSVPRVATTEPTTTTTTSTTTTTTTSTVPPARHKRGKCPNYEQLFRDYGLEPVRVFSHIAWRESRCTPTAMNTTLNRDGSFDSGLLQINSTWKTVTRNVCGGGLELLLEVDCNLRVAKYLLDNGGLGHWGMDG